MSLEVLEEHQNNLLGRREAKIVVHHEGQGTPDRISVRKLAAEHFKAQFDRVYVRSIATKTGGSSALCVVELYQDAKAAEIVPAYLKNRNLPKDQRVAKKKKEAEEKPAPAPKAAAAEKKPAEAKPAEKKEEAKPSPAKDSKPATPTKEAKPAVKPEAKPKA